MFLIPDFQFEMVLIGSNSKPDILLNIDGLAQSMTDDDKDALIKATLDDKRFDELEGITDYGSATRILIQQTITSRLSYLIYLGYLKQEPGDPSSNWTFLAKQYKKDLTERAQNSYRAERSVELG